MNKIAENIKNLREKNDYSQAEIADIIGVPKSTYASYEYAKAEPDAETIAKICKLFAVEFFELLYTNVQPKAKISTAKKRHNIQPIVLPNVQAKGSKYTALHPEPPPLNEPETTYKTAKMPAVITVNERGIDNIIYVPVKARAGYLIGFGDPEFIETLPTFRLPGLNNATYRMFEVDGLSMSPTLLNNDRVIGEWVPSISEIRENRVHIVVTKTGIVIKRVLNRTAERGKIYLKSDTITHRHEHSIMEIDPSDIVEIWYVHLKLSADLSEPAEVYTRLADLEINQLKIMEKLKLK